MAVQFEGGVVIGADSRTTTGSYIVRRFLTTSSRRNTQMDPLRCTGKSSDRQVDSHP